MPDYSPPPEPPVRRLRRSTEMVARVLRRRMLHSIAVRLMSGFLLVIVTISAIFSVVGIRIIARRVVTEAENKVQTDLNAAREIYLNALSDVFDVIRFGADRFYLGEAVLSGDLTRVAVELTGTLRRENLDVLTLTDRSGFVLVRAANPGSARDSRAGDDLVAAVLAQREPLAATSIVAAGDLREECPPLAELAYCQLVASPGARPRTDTAETSGMMLKAAAPVFDRQERFIGVLYGGTLLNHRHQLVDRITRTVFREARYEGAEIGAATIFQDDIRIATSLRNEDGSRAIGTRASQDIHDRVVRAGRPWVGRSQAVSRAYLAMYEPIRDIRGTIIGMLAVGILEAPYADLQRRTTALFLAITFAGAVLALGLAYLIATRLTGPIRQLVAASRELARGELNARVSLESAGEYGELAHAFNSMASALRERDEQLKDFAQRKIRESERLAVIGQLAADVAHELNNPLQGIVAYSHLLLERGAGNGASAASVEKIVTQANRCTRIVRGLLDFARPRTPNTKSSDVNGVLQECLSLVENQAVFHDIAIVRELDPALPSVVIDPSQMQQVFMNMLINAAEAMDGGGVLTISTQYDRAARAIAVRFADTGHGISKENLERIFDPFFTTKEVGHGTGLGLAISYGIVKEHHGSIAVDSEVGAGTTFTVRIPRRTEEGP